MQALQIRSPLPELGENVTRLWLAPGLTRIWDTNTGKEMRSFNWDIGKVQVAAISPDGMLCAAGSNDGRIVVWDVDV